MGWSGQGAAAGFKDYRSGASVPAKAQYKEWAMTARWYNRLWNWGKMIARHVYAKFTDGGVIVGGQGRC